ncbi:heavy-metal-associated domain-containing protein [Porphyromonas loveana]|uniref:heavy-metal-associated domain-containing protein n=1 Tax=Porphyromonas loveana TaxID=1884669 RepID=UPI00359F7E17
MHGSRVGQRCSPTLHLAYSTHALRVLRKKIRRVLQFEKGMKDIQFDLEKNTILIVFDPAKTSLEKLATKLEKIGYEIEVTDESGRPLPKKEKN